MYKVNSSTVIVKFHRIFKTARHRHPIPFSKSYYLKPKVNLMESKYRFFFWRSSICDDLRDLVPFVQFKICEKHPWRGVTLSKVAG